MEREGDFAPPGLTSERKYLLHGLQEKGKEGKKGKKKLKKKKKKNLGLPWKEDSGYSTILASLNWGTLQKILHIT
jgi:hypothetical protein